jgi:hypothetical protein
MRLVVRALRTNVMAARRKEGAAQRMIARLREFRTRAIMKARARHIQRTAGRNEYTHDRPVAVPPA